MTRTIFAALAWALAVGIAGQVALAGLAIFVDSSWWAIHRTYVVVLEIISPLMLLFAFLARRPASLRWLSAAAFGVIGVQYATIGLGAPLAALHPVNAMLLFWLAVTLALKTRAEAQQHAREILAARAT